MFFELLVLWIILQLGSNSGERLEVVGKAIAAMTVDGFIDLVERQRG